MQNESTKGTAKGEGTERRCTVCRADLGDNPIGCLSCGTTLDRMPTTKAPPSSKTRAFMSFREMLEVRRNIVEGIDGLAQAIKGLASVGPEREREFTFRYPALEMCRDIGHLFRMRPRPDGLGLIGVCERCAAHSDTRALERHDVTRIDNEETIVELEVDGKFVRIDEARALETLELELPHCARCGSTYDVPGMLCARCLFESGTVRHVSRLAHPMADFDENDEDDDDDEGEGDDDLDDDGEIDDDTDYDDEYDDEYDDDLDDDEDD